MSVDYYNIVRVGKVSSVDVPGRTVRVAFEDKTDTEGKPLISGALKVLRLLQSKSGLRNWARKISGIMKRGTIRKIEGSNWAKAM